MPLQINTRCKWLRPRAVKTQGGPDLDDMRWLRDYCPEALGATAAGAVGNGWPRLPLCFLSPTSAALSTCDAHEDGMDQAEAASNASSCSSCASSSSTCPRGPRQLRVCFLKVFIHGVGECRTSERQARSSQQAVGGLQPCWRRALIAGQLSACPSMPSTHAAHTRKKRTRRTSPRTSVLSDLRNLTMPCT